MAIVLKKKIPWQERESLGNTKAFFMTLIEALFSPIDYYEKLEVQEDYQHALVLSFLNYTYLAAPLLAHILSWPAFLGVLFILLITPILLWSLAFIMQKVLLFFGQKTTHRSHFHILAYATPVFVLAYVPHVGYWLAAFAMVVLVGIGQNQVHKIGFGSIFPTIVFVPFLVLIPFNAVRFSQNWEKTHPRVDIEMEAQKVLAVISIAAENYALTHQGNYPTDSAVFTAGPKPYLVRDYCGVTINNYKIICDLRSHGYYIKARPEGFEGRGKRTFWVTTGGKLRER